MKFQIGFSDNKWDDRVFRTSPRFVVGIGVTKIKVGISVELDYHYDIQGKKSCEIILFLFYWKVFFHFEWGKIIKE